MEVSCEGRTGYWMFSVQLLSAGLEHSEYRVLQEAGGGGSLGEGGVEMLQDEQECHGGVRE